MTERATAPRDADVEETADAGETATVGETTDAEENARDRRATSTADLAATPRSAPERRPDRTDADRPGRAHGEPDRNAALFDRGAAEQLQKRWQAIQVEFVDQPRGAVEQADGLVAEVMQQLAESFASERRELEAAWSGGQEASTEDLRQAIRRYRSFFNRLLGV